MQILPADPTFNTLLAQLLPQKLAGGIAQGLQAGYESNLLKNALMNPQQGYQAQVAQIAGLPISEELKKLGTERLQQGFAAETIGEQFGPEAKKLFLSLPVGGQTEFTKILLDLTGRNIKYKDFLSGNIPRGQVAQEQGEIKEKYEFPEIPPVQKKTPKELSAYHDKLRTENLPHLTQAQNHTRTLKKEGDSLNVLSSLNQSGKLPQDLGRVVIDKETGEPYKVAQLVGAVSPETQRFVKTLNDFVTKAKDSFGARVTNFDLQSFMKRLPSLLNTQEGRRQIIDQLRIINQLDYLYEKALRDTFVHYGAGNVAYEQAIQIAEDMIAPQEEALTAQFDRIGEERASEGEFSSLPPPGEYAGQSIVDDENGAVFRSDGNKWTRVK